MLFAEEIGPVVGTSLAGNAVLLLTVVGGGIRWYLVNKATERAAEAKRQEEARRQEEDRQDRIRDKERAQRKEDDDDFNKRFGQLMDSRQKDCDDKLDAATKRIATLEAKLDAYIQSDKAWMLNYSRLFGYAEYAYGVATAAGGKLKPPPQDASGTYPSPLDPPTPPPAGGK